MAGYYVHLSMCGGQTLNNRSFVLGVEAPDMLKKHVKFCGSLDGARAKYNALRTNEMPEYQDLMERILQKETADSSDGLHYGLSSNPDILACWESLSESQRANPFYRGYVYHLISDKAIYARQRIDDKFREVMQANRNNPNIAELQKSEVQKLHNDWDRTNALVRDTYGVSLTDEVKELGVVQFIDEGELNYIDWVILKDTIDWFRTFNPLDDDMNIIIDTVLNNI